MQRSKLQRIMLAVFLCFLLHIPVSLANIFVKDLGSNRFKLTYIPEVKFDTVVSASNTSEKYLLPVINNTFFNSDDIGAPIQRQFSYKLNIPSDYNSHNFIIEDYEVHFIKNISGKIAPVPTMMREDDIYVEKYILSQDKYDKYYNKINSKFQWVEVKYAGVSRGQHLASVVFSPVKYNPQAESIEISSQIDVIIKLINNTDTSMYLNTSTSTGATNTSSDITTATTTNNNNIDTSLDTIISAKNNKKIQNFSNRQDLNELSDGVWFRIGIKDEGVYRLTASDLSEKGINIPVDKIKTIKIFGNSGAPLSEIVSDGRNNILQEQEILVSTKKDGTLDYITFYASGISGITISESNNFKYPTHYLNFMDNNNYYLLTYGGADGKRAVAHKQPDAEPVYKPRSYLATIYHEEDLVMPYFWGGGKIWLGESINNFPIVHSLHNLSRNGQYTNITYLFSVAHVSERDGKFDFKFGNNTNLSSKYNLRASTGAYVAATLGTSEYFNVPIDMIPLDNRAVLNIEYSGSNTGIPYLNYYELHYPREFVPIDGEINFFSDTNQAGITEYNINGFTGDIFGFDVTNPSNPKLLYNNALTGGMFIFKVDIPKDKYNRYFLASKIKKPVVFEKIEMDNLRGRDANADVIIITHEALIPSAKKFAEYRSKQSNYNTTVVSVNKIYNEFSHSRCDLTAIRDYIQYAYNNWETKPQYVVLWGMGHYDYRGIEYKTNNFVPAYQYDSQFKRIKPGNYEGLTDNQQCYATDEFYVCVDGNDWFSDLSIGRVPIISNEQGEAYISKLYEYENRSNNNNWRNNIILWADDDVTTSGFEGAGYHCKDAEEISRRIPMDFNQTKIYSVVYPVEIQGGARRKPKVTQELLNATSITGASVLFYTGHGNPNRLMHEDVLLREVTLNQFNNADKLFYFMASSCEVGRFDKSGSNCIGTEIVTLPKTGAIASISATRVSGIKSNTDFYCFLYDSLFTRNNSGDFISIGEASKIAKSRYGGVAPTPEALMYVLLGDPTLKLIFPKHEIVVRSINNIQLDEDTTTVVAVKALSKISIVGEIIDINTRKKIDDFNGTVMLTLDEAPLDIIYQCEHGDSDKHRFKQKGATINKSAFSVVNGEFKSEFVIPGDISFSDENAILYLYAFSNDSIKFAKGATNKLKINDIDNTLVNDENGPDICIYIDSREYFSKGGVVSQTPLLLVDISDETGINATGLGIGHRIEAWIDDDPNPIDLTPKYISSMTNPNAGSISQYIYDLSSGRHKIKIRAWDVFNNYGIGETEFIIPEGGSEVFYASFGPNPILRSEVSDANLILRHNFIPPVDVEIILFDAFGNTLSTVGDRTSVISVHSADIFPIKNFINKNKLTTGTYYYKIRCIYNRGKNIYEKFGCLGVVID